MIFNSFTDKIVWKIKTKWISRRYAKGIKPTQAEWNYIARPYLRQAIEDVFKKCPYEKMMFEKGE